MISRSWIIFLAVTIQRWASSSTVSCEDAARQLGQPVDGWRMIKNRAQVSGQRERCIREAVELQCSPLGTQVYNPDTRVAECCPADGTIVWHDEEAQLGFCCAAGHEWTGNISSGEGGCCPIGTVMTEGRCIKKPDIVVGMETAATECGCSSKRLSPPKEEQTFSVEEEEGDAADNTLELGIRFGRCYRLSVSDGKPVGSNRENAVYTPGGLFDNIQFRICRTTRDCSPGKHDGVTSDTPFFVQDQVGRHNDPNGTMGWVAKHKLGALKMMFTPDAEDATSFVANRDAGCSDGLSCGLKLRGLPLKLTFSETWCHIEDDSMISVSADPQPNKDEL